jgi:dihydrolipoamide dehydrogenase
MEPKRNFKVAVIGGGPAGYVAAIQAAHSGQSVALIEAEDMGGTCLNWGCIPTKTLLAGAEVYHKMKNAHNFGIQCDNISFDFAKMKDRKDDVILKIRKSLEGLIAAHKITILRGFGQIVSPHEIKITGEVNEVIEADNIIIATGSRPKKIGSLPFDWEKVHDSSSMLEVSELPKKVVIIGGGVIGCEFASLYAEFGVEVIVLEALASILPLEAKAVSQALSAAFTKKGIKCKTGVFVERIEHLDNGLKVHIKDNEPIECDMALVAIGRDLNTSGIGLEKAGVVTDEKGAIIVNDKMQTSVPHIYAIGDITAKVMLAHVASHQGIVAAKNATGEPSVMHYHAVPNVIFTHPEIATVGLSLEAAIAKGYKAHAGKFPFLALGKSIASIETEGFAQVIVDSTTGQILGAQVVGHEASALIAEMTLAIQNEMTLESIVETIHAHPTIAESWLEASLIASGTPIHFPPLPKKV